MSNCNRCYKQFQKMEVKFNIGNVGDENINRKLIYCRECTQSNYIGKKYMFVEMSNMNFSNSNVCVICDNSTKTYVVNSIFMANHLPDNWLKFKPCCESHMKNFNLNVCECGKIIDKKICKDEKKCLMCNICSHT